MWRRTSRTCQIMELDEGPPDHARSTWERRNTAGGHHISNMKIPLHPAPPSTMDIPTWSILRAQARTAGGAGRMQLGQAACRKGGRG